MAIRVRLDHLLLDNRLTLTDLADRIGNHDRESVDSENEQGPCHPLFQHWKRCAVSSIASPAICSSGDQMIKLRKA